MEGYEYLNAAIAAQKAGPGHTEEAKNYFQMILQDDPDNSIAQFFNTYYAIVAEDAHTLYDRYMTFSDIMQLAIVESYGLDMSEDKKEDIVEEIADTIRMLPMFVHQKLDKITHGKEAREQLEQVNRSSILHFYFLGDNIELIYTENSPITKNIAVEMWKAGIKLQCQWVGVPCDKEDLTKYSEKIKKYEPDYIPPKENPLRKLIARAILLLSKNQG